MKNVMRNGKILRIKDHQVRGDDVYYPKKIRCQKGNDVFFMPIVEFHTLYPEQLEHALLINRNGDVFDLGEI